MGYMNRKLEVQRNEKQSFITFLFEMQYFHPVASYIPYPYCSEIFILWIFTFTNISMILNSMQIFQIMALDLCAILCRPPLNLPIIPT